MQGTCDWYMLRVRGNNIHDPGDMEPRWKIYSCAADDNETVQGQWKKRVPWANLNLGEVQSDLSGQISIKLHSFV